MAYRTLAEVCLRHYLIVGVASFLMFPVLVVVLWLNVMKPGLDMPLLFGLLLVGYAWLGATVMGRHCYVRAATALGCDVTVWEFLATQLSFPCFPFLYWRLQKRMEQKQSSD